MLAVITIRTKCGCGPQKVLSKQLVNITKRRFSMFANEITTWDFQQEKVWKHLSACEEGMITPIHPRQTLNNLRERDSLSMRKDTKLG